MKKSAPVVRTRASERVSERASERASERVACINKSAVCAAGGGIACNPRARRIVCGARIVSTPSENERRAVLTSIKRTPAASKWSRGLNRTARFYFRPVSSCRGSDFLCRVPFPFSLYLSLSLSLFLPFSLSLPLSFSRLRPSPTLCRAISYSGISYELSG